MGEYKYINYSVLKAAYKEVKTFVEGETFGKVESLQTKIEDDLGCTGDDSLELLEKFVKKYNLDPSGFNYQRHFHTEYELYGSETALFKLIYIPLLLVGFLVKVVTLGKTQPNKVIIKIIEQTTRKQVT